MNTVANNLNMRQRCLFARFMTFVRSAITGGAASLVDWFIASVLFVVLTRTGAFGGDWFWITTAASVPALLAGAAIQFLGNRNFAFKSKDGHRHPLKKQLWLFAGAEAVTLLLNHWAFVALVYLLPHTEFWAIAARPVSTNVVFLLWSYPVWRKIFAVKQPVAVAGAGDTTVL